MLTRNLRTFTLFTLFVGLSGLMFSLTGCGGSGSVTWGGGTGPSGSSSFSGTTVAINPTLQFLSGGVVNYQNTESSSSFPTSVAVTAGTYTYVPASDYKTGILTVTLGAPVNTSVTLNITDFAGSNGNVTAFKASYNGTSYTGNVTAGTLSAHASSGGSGSVSVGGTTTSISGSGSSSSGSGSISVINLPGSGGLNSDPLGGFPLNNGLSLNAAMTATESQPGSPYPKDTKVTFGIAQNTLSFSGKTLTSPTVVAIDMVQKYRVYTDSSTGLVYKVLFNGEAFNGQITVVNGSGAFVTAFVL